MLSNPRRTSTAAPTAFACRQRHPLADASRRAWASPSHQPGHALATARSSLHPRLQARLPHRANEHCPRCLCHASHESAHSADSSLTSATLALVEGSSRPGQFVLGTAARTGRVALMHRSRPNHSLNRTRNGVPVTSNYKGFPDFASARDGF